MLKEVNLKLSLYILKLSHYNNLIQDSHKECFYYCFEIWHGFAHIIKIIFKSM